jgi:hypothetical protein
MTKLAALSSLAIACATLAVGCGGSSTSDGNTGGSGATAGTGGSGASAGTGGSGASAGTGGSGASAGSGGGVSCDDFKDESSAGTVTFRLTNARPTPIYLGGGNGCGPAELYGLEGPAGLVQKYANGCGNTCEMLQHQGDYCAGGGACQIPSVVMIAPGGHYDTTWAALDYVTQNMPLSCYFEPQYAPPTCSQRVAAQAGTYTVSSTAMTDLDCLDVGICPCIPDASGSCEIPYSGTPSGTSVDAATKFELTGTQMVEVTFQ